MNIEKRIEPHPPDDDRYVDLTSKDDCQTTNSLYPAFPRDQTVPLFLQDSRNGDQGNAQDEKDSAQE